MLLHTSCRVVGFLRSLGKQLLLCGGTTIMLSSGPTVHHNWVLNHRNEHTYYTPCTGSDKEASQVGVHQPVQRRAGTAEARGVDNLAVLPIQMQDRVPLNLRTWKTQLEPQLVLHNTKISIRYCA